MESDGATRVDARLSRRAKLHDVYNARKAKRYNIRVLRVKQSRADQSRAEQSRAEQNRTEQSSSGQS
uniref:Uncharacterized protein n=1 Tax=Vespula pensylvanica TaxID=30213 RepID=A0A834KLU3_VESPE|nr:hypothetical protein H0235_013983 [Vespula pensylvanica]